MKANEFIKKYGLEKAIDVLKRQPPMNSSRYRARDDKYSATISTGDSVSTIELKRLVESHDLIYLCGGLDVAKNLDPRFLPNWVESVNQAIADVESCQ